jgi:hypothetical protein
MRSGGRQILFGLLLACCAAGALPDEVAAPGPNPTGGGGSVVLEPVPPAAEPHAATPRSRRLVFVCQDGTGPVFSDRPCSVQAERRELSVAQSAGATASTAPPVPGAAPRATARRPTTLPPAGATPADPCRRLRDQLEELNDRMRSGYSAREAARLWTRWRDLKARIRERRC